jgi:hypothetical protein
MLTARYITNSGKMQRAERRVVVKYLLSLLR